MIICDDLADSLSYTMHTIKELNKINDVIMGTVPAGAKICFASTPVRQTNFFKKYMEENMTGHLGYAPIDSTPFTTNCHKITIEKVANGFVLEIGCKKFVGTNWETVSKQLGEYWKDPVAAEKKYCK
jgi:hypothetical protein